MGFQKVASLWENMGKKGKYLSGQANEDIKKGDKLFVFKVGEKMNPKGPDYTVSRGDGNREG